MTLYRPLIATGGAYALAGGWARFDRVAVLGADTPQTLPAADIPATDLARITRPRAPIAGLEMARPNIMGILNVTPDSFSDGGRFNSVTAGVDQAMAMVQQGADILDIGGESTRPGAAEVSIDEELSRTIPMIDAIRARSDVPLSIDTRKAPVGQAALAAGATLVNDVSGFTFDPALARVTATAQAPACLMHAQGLPATMQNNPAYDDVVTDVAQALAGYQAAAAASGVAPDQIMVDPGIGFGKTQNHNLLLLRTLSVLHGLGAPILVGASRKRFIGTLTGVEDAAGRVHGSVAVALTAVAQGAQVVRVHDVAATKHALTMWMAVQGS